jgi:hypothetical protein
MKPTNHFQKIIAKVSLRGWMKSAFHSMMVQHGVTGLYD